MYDAFAEATKAGSFCYSPQYAGSCTGSRNLACPGCGNNYRGTCEASDHGRRSQHPHSASRNGATDSRCANLFPIYATVRVFNFLEDDRA
jgi:hypothetical protein